MLIIQGRLLYAYTLDVGNRILVFLTGAAFLKLNILMYNSHLESEWVEAIILYTIYMHTNF